MKHAWKWASDCSGRARCKRCPASLRTRVSGGPKGGAVVVYRARPGAKVTSEQGECCSPESRQTAIEGARAEVIEAAKAWAESAKCATREAQARYRASILALIAVVERLNAREAAAKSAAGHRRGER